MSQWADSERWARLRTGEACVICRQGMPNDLRGELERSWVTVNADAPMRGYACLVFMRHVVVLLDLSEDDGVAFMRDGRRVSAAGLEVTGGVKLY